MSRQFFGFLLLVSFILLVFETGRFLGFTEALEICDLLANIVF